MTPDVADGERDLAVESWAFALQLYQQPDVTNACLQLQADAGVDVMLLLFVVFALTKAGMAIDAQDVEAMDAVCRPWREQIVHPLRALRVALKSGPSPAPSQTTEALRSQIKAAELSAERVENDLLAHWLRRKIPSARGYARDTCETAIRSVVSLALKQHGAPPDEHLWRTVDTIVAAADSIAP